MKLQPAAEMLSLVAIPPSASRQECFNARVHAVEHERLFGLRSVRRILERGKSVQHVVDLGALRCNIVVI